MEENVVRINEIEELNDSNNEIEEVSEDYVPVRCLRASSAVSWPPL